MTTTTATRTTSALTAFWMATALVLALLLLAGSQVETSARGQGGPPIDPPGKGLPSDSGNSMDDDPADNGITLDTVDDDRPGTITAPIEWDMTFGQTQPSTASAVECGIDGPRCLLSLVPRR